MTEGQIRKAMLAVRRTRWVLLALVSAVWLLLVSPQLAVVITMALGSSRNGPPYSVLVLSVVLTAALPSQWGVFIREKVSSCWAYRPSCLDPRPRLGATVLAPPRGPSSSKE